ncbi:MAG: ankyrin repeat domain-containing protein, partial [bacterium]|nr:ankyrin repeat domain-containing protein [bacterium]
LFNAAYHSYLDTFELLLNSGADVSVKSSRGTVSDFAKSRNKVVMLTLIENARQNKKRNSDDDIMDAAGRGRINELKTLLNNDISIGFINKYGQTPLTEALKNGQKESAEYLINNGFDVNQRDGKNISPLMYAAVKGWPDVICLMVLMGAKTDSYIDNDMDTLELAQSYGQHNIIKMLKTIEPCKSALKKRAEEEKQLRIKQYHQKYRNSQNYRQTPQDRQDQQQQYKQQ